MFILLAGTFALSLSLSLSPLTLSSPPSLSRLDEREKRKQDLLGIDFANFLLLSLR